MGHPTGALARAALDGLGADLAELAAHLDMTLDDLDEVLLSAKTALEASLDEGANLQLGQLLSDPKTNTPEDTLGRTELLQAMTAAVADLPEQEKSVITLYYAEELLLREISDLLGVTESRVSQIHTRALYRLNRALAPMAGDLEV